MRKGGTSALLQKVNAQLRGERVSKQPEEKDEVEAYLSGLNLKASNKIDWDKFGEVSDISISEDETPKAKAQEVPPANKFLKKKPVPQQNENVAVQSKPTTAQASKTASSKVGVSAALDKVKAFSNKYSTKTVAKRPPVSSVLSDSDMDLSISLDEDVLATVPKSRTVPSTSTGIASNFTKSSKILSVQSSVETQESDEDSFKLGRGGNKFMKKKTPAPEAKKVEAEVEKEEITKPSSQTKGGNQKFQLASAQKYSTQVKLDTDEESLADFIQGLSVSSGMTVSPPKTPREQVTRKPKIKSAKSVDSESEIQSQVSTDDSIHSISKAGKVVDLQEVSTISEESVVQKVKKKPEKRKTDAVEKSVFKSFGLQTLDDLDMEEDIDIQSEIQSRSPSPLKSILSTTPRPVTPKSNRSRVRYSIDEVTEIRSRSPSPDPVSTARQVESVLYTDEFEVPTETVKSSHSSKSDSEYTSQVTDTDSKTMSTKSGSPRDTEKDDYSDDFIEEESRSQSESESSRSQYEDSTYYSDSYTSTVSEDSYTRSSTSRSIPKRRKKVKVKTQDTQTLPEPGLWYHWNLERGSTAIIGQQYGLADVDPTPIATHVVSADALEAMTAYSPSVLAMNEMLRQQLKMTQHFLENHRRMHQSYVGTMSPDCAYTTLEDTKQYLEKNRKPRLTFDEALRLVKEEMGLS